MSRPNFIVKVPSIPARPKPRNRNPKRKNKPLQPDSYPELETINESFVSNTNQSSYYSLDSSETSEPRIRVIERYDEFLNLKDLDKLFWKASNNTFNCDSLQSDQSIFLLKQICADLNLDVPSSDRDSNQVLSLYQKDRPGPQSDLQTAIVAKRIMDTQEQIANNGKTGFSKDSLKKSSFNKSNKSLRPINEEVLDQTLSNLASIYSIKHRCATKEVEVQVNFGGSGRPGIKRLNCNTQTNLDSVKNIAMEVQTCCKSSVEDKLVNTCLHPTQEQSTQMYEHITENDLLCMEWIDKNLFRVPVNPNTIIVDERLRETSEITCLGTNVFEQELKWERHALCP